MDLYKIIAIALVSVAIMLIVRQFNKDISIALSIGVGVLVLSMVCDELFQVVYTFYNLSEKANVNGQAIECVIKVVGIGYVAEFCNNLCIDTNNKSIGDKVLIASRIAIILCALPIIEQLFDVIESVLL